MWARDRVGGREGGDGMLRGRDSREVCGREGRRVEEEEGGGGREGERERASSERAVSSRASAEGGADGIVGVGRGARGKGKEGLRRSKAVEEGEKGRQASSTGQTWLGRITRGQGSACSGVFRRVPAYSADAEAASVCVHAVCPLGHRVLR